MIARTLRQRESVPVQVAVAVKVHVEVDDHVHVNQDGQSVWSPTCGELY
jgi:hypothetical protein